MSRNDFQLSTLTPEQVQCFFRRPFRKRLARHTTNYYRQFILHYLEWLYARQQLAFDPEPLRQRARIGQPLAPIPRAFARQSKWPTEPVLRLFHRWMIRRGLSLETLSGQQVQHFFRYLAQGPFVESTKTNYRYGVLRYLQWLYEKQHLSFDPESLRQRVRIGQPLGPIPMAFARQSNQWPRVSFLRLFYRWMNPRKLTLQTLSAEQIRHFLSDLSQRPWTKRSKNNYRCKVFRYLDWLYEKDLLRFDPDQLREYPKRLPESAHQFLATLAPTLRSSTHQGYRSYLRKFHSWLRRSEIALSDLQRPHLVAWFGQLKDAGLAPKTRLTTLVTVRSYLRWLDEQRLLQANPEALIRPGDMPKLPTYLPRPLPLEVDRELQRRLASSCSVVDQGLLLMRRTGLRIGELIRLERDCVRTDLDANRFLKVPLGKLNTERLVPLDVDTLRIVRRLQRIGAKRRKYLIVTKGHKQPSYEHYRQALREACRDLDTSGPIGTHRLRHTFATTLLGAGMSLVGLMKLLGHRDFRMTLRYAAITQEAITKEYYAALSQIENKYSVSESTTRSVELNPVKSLSDIARWIRNELVDSPSKKRLMNSILKRLTRIQTDINNLMKS